jgi:hypothetical protein
MLCMLLTQRAMAATLPRRNFFQDSMQAMSRDRVRRIVNALALAALVVWPAYGAVGRALRNPEAWPADDFKILSLGSTRIVAAQQYDPSLYFLYTPPAVVAMAATSWLPLNTAAAIWVAVSVLATIGSLALATSLAGLKSHPWRWTIAFAGLLLVSHFVIRDLRSANCNMIYCFLLVGALASLERGRDVLAGLLLASSIILKLYPVLVLLYLLWIGKRRAFAASVAFLALYATVLPVAAFGVSGAVDMYGSWWEHLRHVQERLRTEDHLILISLPYTLNRVFSPTVGPWLVSAASAVWLGTLAACLWSGRRRRFVPSGWDLAVDGGMLGLATVVISPYLESYHPVVAILPVIALMAKAAQASSTRRTAVVAGAALLCGALIRSASGEMIVGQMHLDGVGIYLQMLLAAAALVAIRWMPPGQSTLATQQPIAYQRAA